MRRALTLIALLLVPLLAACVHFAGGEGAPDVALRAMTFNIRVDVASDGVNAWPQRRALVAELIRHEAPDVLGLQEVLLHQKRDLEAALPEYAMAGVARGDGKEAGEFSPLAWRRDRFDLVRSGTFWLSSTPDAPSKGWDAALPRIATWAVLRERASGRLVRVLNTHFDHVGVEARAESAALIARWVVQGPNAGLPAIVLGDLNSTPDSEPYRRLADDARAELTDSRAMTSTPPYGPPGTFTGFRIDSDAAAPIDHIFVTPDVAVDGYAVITQHWGGRLPSDHYPVLATLRLAGR